MNISESSRNDRSYKSTESSAAHILLMRKECISRTISAAEQSLKIKLCSLKPDNLGLSPYNARYLQNKLLNIQSVLELYGSLLRMCLADQDKPLSQCTIIDYGGGIGVLSLLAVEAGIGNVVYNDIYEVSCGDVKKLAAAVRVKLPHVVCGDIDKLLDTIESKSFEVDGIVSYDVLEHIYDIKSHFSTIRSRVRHPVKIIYGSGANAKNPVIVRSLAKVQQDVENNDRNRQACDKARDSSLSYLKIRKDIISRNSPQLAEGEINRLAIATRGLREDDISQVVQSYMQTGKIAYSINHPTNTCDPLTGNWCEHLIEPKWLRSKLEEIGYSTKIQPGMYHAPSTGLKGYAKRLLNGIIRVLGDQGVIVAPYYVVVARARPTREKNTGSY